MNQIVPSPDDTNAKINSIQENTQLITNSQESKQKNYSLKESNKPNQTGIQISIKEEFENQYDESQELLISEIQKQEQINIIESQIDNWPSIYQIWCAKPQLSLFQYCLVLLSLTVTFVPPAAIFLSFFLKTDFEICPKKADIIQRVEACIVFILLTISLFQEFVQKRQAKAIVSKNILFYSYTYMIDSLFELQQLIHVLAVTFILFVKDSDATSLLLNSLAAVLITQFDEILGSLISKYLVKTALLYYTDLQMENIYEYTQNYFEFVLLENEIKSKNMKELLIQNYKNIPFTQKSLPSFLNKIQKLKQIKNQVPADDFDYQQLKQYQWSIIKNDLSIILKLSQFPSFQLYNRKESLQAEFLIAKFIEKQDFNYLIELQTLQQSEIFVENRIQNVEDYKFLLKITENEEIINEEKEQFITRINKCFGNILTSIISSQKAYFILKYILIFYCLVCIVGVTYCV